jgi:hypothetical protein
MVDRAACAQYDLALSFGNCSKIFYARREDKRFDTTKTRLGHRTEKPRRRWQAGMAAPLRSQIALTDEWVS